MKKANTANSQLYPSRTDPWYNILSLLRSRLVSFTQNHLNGEGQGVLLDFGCGDAPYRKLFQPHVREYIRLDLETNHTADQFIDIDSNSTLPGGFADVVLSTQVLEHVANPINYLSEAYRLLKKGGYLVLSTHGYWVYHPSPTDFWRWTSDGLKKIISDTGFTIVEFSGLLGPAASGLVILQDSVARKIPRMHRPFFLFSQTLIRWVDALESPESRDRDACVYFVIAQKGTTDS